MTCPRRRGGCDGYRRRGGGACQVVPVWPPRLAYLYAHGDTRGLSVRKATVSEEQGLRTLREDNVRDPDVIRIVDMDRVYQVSDLLLQKKKVSDLSI